MQKTLQRKRDVGSKFDGEKEDAEWEFPRASIVEWDQVPRQEAVEKPFNPKQEHLPIGNTEKYVEKRLFNLRCRKLSTCGKCVSPVY